MQLTLADFQGIFVILLIVFIAIAIVKKAMKFVLFCVSLLCLMQVGFMLSQTSLNDKIPLDKYFKYDIVSSITQIWNDTDKEQLEQDIKDTADKIVDQTGQLIDKVTSSNTTEEVPNESTPDSSESGTEITEDSNSE